MERACFKYYVEYFSSLNYLSRCIRSFFNDHRYFQTLDFKIHKIKVLGANGFEHLLEHNYFIVIMNTYK